MSYNNPDELLAMLSPKSSGLRIGNGGVPDITREDVTGALGIAESVDRVGVKIYLAAYAPQESIPRDILDVLSAVQLEEWRNRSERLMHAQIAEAHASRLQRGHEKNVAIERACMMMAGAKAAMWPHITGDTWGLISQTIVAEMRCNRVCDDCKGSQFVRTNDRMTPCEKCSGTGRIRISDRQRAIALKLNPSSYMRVWRPPYEWMNRFMFDAASRGRRAFSNGLGRMPE